MDTYNTTIEEIIQEKRWEGREDRGNLKFYINTLNCFNRMRLLKIYRAVSLRRYPIYRATIKDPQSATIEQGMLLVLTGKIPRWGPE